VKVRLHEQAYNDVDDAAVWYDEQEVGLGDEFLAEVNACVVSLSEQAEIWPVWPGVQPRKYPVRRRLLSRFPYGIAYQVIGDTIIVLSVAAYRMRPRYWANRIQR
jgi:toxin ParE1/3/4